MEYQVKGRDILLWQPDLELEHTLDCGQAFRWATVDGGKSYSGCALNTPLTIRYVEGEKGLFLLENTDESTFLDLWKGYFDLDRDYTDCKSRFSADETLKSACEFAWGIRLLKQDSWEALSSFIISQNNNIPRIKGIIERMCGIKNRYPSPEDMASFTDDEWASLRVGFREKYLRDASQKISTGSVDLKKVSEMPIDEAREALKTISGVGPKVAECALLYGMARVECFPIDVWIKKVLARYYPQGFPELFYAEGGIAQQYLFHYIRKGVEGGTVESLD